MRLNALLSRPDELESKMRDPVKTGGRRQGWVRIDADARWVIPVIQKHNLAVLEKENGIRIDELAANLAGEFERFLAANDPERMKKMKAPFGSDVDPIAAEDLIIMSGTTKPNDE